MDDALASAVLARLREVDVANPLLGLRAYILPVDETL